jgi:hypothetical protein
MYKTKITSKKVEVLKDVICDSCGKSCMDSIKLNYEYLTLTGYWGYGSKKDGQKWEAHICEKCVDRKFKHIKFNKVDYMLDGIRVLGYDKKLASKHATIIQD